MYKRYSGSAEMSLIGGLTWHNGFTIGSSQGPYKPGFATFRLGGEYGCMLFVLGRIYDPESLDHSKGGRKDNL